MLGRVLIQLAEDLIRGLGGPVGQRLRRAWYRRRLAGCGSGLVIDAGVYISGAAHITLGDNVWLDKGVVLIAGPPRAGARIVSGDRAEGRLVLGSDCHVGIGTVIQAHGGVTIGDCFTSSAGVRIYSFSNDPAECRAGTTEFGRNDPGYRSTPVAIGRNVWLGIGVVVVGGMIGADVFVRSQSLVTGEIPAGHVAGGKPAVPLRPRFPEPAA